MARCSFSAAQFGTGIGDRPVGIDNVVDEQYRSPGEADRHIGAGSAISGHARCSTSRSGGKFEVAIDFIGFSISDVFVVGYGTDYAEKYRHLPYIGVVE